MTLSHKRARCSASTVGESRYSRPLHSPGDTHWIQYTDGSIRTFRADTEKAAFAYYKSEGDHALDFGEIE